MRVSRARRLIKELTAATGGELAFGGSAIAELVDKKEEDDKSNNNSDDNNERDGMVTMMTDGDLVSRKLSKSSSAAGATASGSDGFAMEKTGVDEHKESIAYITEKLGLSPESMCIKLLPFLYDNMWFLFLWIVALLLSNEGDDDAVVNGHFATDSGKSLTDYREMYMSEKRMTEQHLTRCVDLEMQIDRLVNAQKDASKREKELMKTTRDLEDKLVAIKCEFARVSERYDSLIHENSVIKAENDTLKSIHKEAGLSSTGASSSKKTGGVAAVGAGAKKLWSKRKKRGDK